MNLYQKLIRFISDWWLAISILSGFALLQILTIGYVVHVPFIALMTDVFLYTFFYGVVAILLWNTIKYANFNTLSSLQQAIIYSALVLLSLAIIIGGGMGIYTYLPFSGSELLINFIPVRVLISLLIVVILLQHISIKICEINNNEIPLSEQSEAIQGNIISTETKTGIERIAVKSGSKIHVIQVSEIIYVQSDGDYVHIFTLTGKYLKEQTMKYFEENLPVEQFVRVHRSYIVNVQSIARVELYDKQNQQLTLKNGHQIKASQGGYKLLRTKLNL